MKRVFLFAAAISLSGCAYPTSSVEQGAVQSRLIFSAAPVGTSISVDGRERGLQTRAKPLVVDVDPGKHMVEESISGQVVFRAEYYVGAGSTVEVRSPK